MDRGRAFKGKAERLEKVEALAIDRLGAEDGRDLVAFIRAFYDRVTSDDLLEISIDNLYGAALALWKFAATRKPGETSVRAYNPRIDEHGWHASHTVIEIINDDMPFLVDSVVGNLSRMGHVFHLLVHPVVRVARDEAGARQGLLASGEAGIAESVMHFQVGEQTGREALGAIEDRLAEVLADVRLSVEDWPGMMERLDDAIAELEAGVPVEAEESEEAGDFLRWMRSNHFTFLGCRDFAYAKKRGKETLEVVDGSGHGILRDPERQVLRGTDGSGLTPLVQRFFQRPELLLITKTSVRGTVHRAVHMDYIGVKRFDKAGKVVGERRFVGLFTSSAYSRTPCDIPILRQRIHRVIDLAGVTADSHNGKALTHILDTYPRDELFQIDLETLHDIATGILDLQERPGIKLFPRRDPFDRFFSCLVFVPRDRLTSELRSRFIAILVKSLNGRLSNDFVQVGESPLARIHIIIGTDPGKAPADPGYPLIEKKLIEAARTWGDDLYEALEDRFGEERAVVLQRRYAKAFPASYAEAFAPERAIGDIEQIEALRAGGEVGLNFYRVIEDPDHVVRFKIYHPGGAVALSDCLPMLEHMGFKVLGEAPFRLTLEDGANIWVQDFEMREAEAAAFDLGELKPKLEAAFLRIWRGELEDDGFNRLVLRAGLEWRQVMAVRAFCKYIRQTGSSFSQEYMEDALAANPSITRRLVRLFELRFDPELEGKRAVGSTAITEEIQEALEAVESLDEDRILRRYLNLLQSMLRTNFYQAGADGEAKSYFSFKLDSQKVAELPLPRPFREIFVYSPRVEGVHLRGGKVARGGLRWSDRREDFRTEVLGLMKAQMVKNAVIIPVGSKGGFFPKQLPVGGDRETVQAEVIASYQTFVRGLLDITDNLSAGNVVSPPSVIRYDEDDPYLVVAADKGTATFSDIANDISVEYGFWLGDAFASGGKTGYDHKEMGITARGAWEAVKRHFREVGRDIQTEDFTVVGIGDMSGDVFGNGMLLSKHIRLLAAFDHRHIFIDPEPDPEASWKERQRLFEVPRSSWRDYDAKLISKGGGIYDRKAKSVTLTPEVKKIAGLDDDAMPPNELINALLKAEVDLLWIGGIGTYVKASRESHGDAGDRANDGLRVNGAELRCKVMGEGGNLGCTQLGRVEYALLGGRLNTDAIDNSAGVDSSDHEVNIKILLGRVVDEGELTEKQRNRQLAEMTDEVGELVLRNNYLQSQALTMAESHALDLLEPQVRYMRVLERQGKLDRRVEFLPDAEVLEERRAAGRGLTRPELSILLAYSKNVLYEEFLASDLTDSEFLLNDVVKYFPRPLRKRFRAQIVDHPLKKEIIATIVANSVVNRVGITFVHDLVEETGESVEAVARAYSTARDGFALRRVWSRVEAVDTQIGAAVQTEILVRVSELLRYGTLWFLRNQPQPLAISDTLKRFAPGIKSVADRLAELASPEEAEAMAARVAEFRAKGVDEVLAARVAGLSLLAAAPDIVLAAGQTGRDVAEVGRVYFLRGARLGLDWLRRAADDIHTVDFWERSAIASLVDDFYDQQRSLSAKVLASANGADPEAIVDDWTGANAGIIARCAKLVEDFQQSGDLDVARPALANRMVRRMFAG